MAFAEGHHCWKFVSPHSHRDLRSVEKSGGEGIAAQVLKPRNAPSMRNIFVSAVASSAAVATFETRILRAVQAWTSIWS